jgi:excisionase family DNA binding protein
VTTLQERGVFGMAEVCEYLHCGPDEIRRLVMSGELRGWRTRGLMGDWRISKAAADEWIALQEERGRMELS